MLPLSAKSSAWNKMESGAIPLFMKPAGSWNPISLILPSQISPNCHSFDLTSSQIYAIPIAHQAKPPVKTSNHGRIYHESWTAGRRVSPCPSEVDARRRTIIWDGGQGQSLYAVQIWCFFYIAEHIYHQYCIHFAPSFSGLLWMSNMHIPLKMEKGSSVSNCFNLWLPSSDRQAWPEGTNETNVYCAASLLLLFSSRILYSAQGSRPLPYLAQKHCN